MKNKNKFFYFGVVAILLFILFPYFWMILASFKTQVDILSKSNLWVFRPTFHNYVDVFYNYDFIKPIINSFIIAIAATLIGLFFGLQGAYAIAKYKMKKFHFAIVLVRVIPIIMLLVPWYTAFVKLKIVDTYLAMTLAHLIVTLPFIIFMMVPFFENLPKELEEAAYVDGCSVMGTFVRIILPLSVPAIVTAAILSFIYSWNNFMFALILSGKKTKTLPVAVFNFISYADINWGGLMAASVVISLPIIALSLMLQRHVIKGLTMGAVKG